MASSHHYRATSCTFCLTLPCLTWGYLYHIPAFGVGVSVVPSLVHISPIYSQNVVTHPDVLNCCWCAGDFHIQLQPHRPQSLHLYLCYPLDISTDMSKWTQLMPLTCSSWNPCPGDLHHKSTLAHQLETFRGLTSFCVLLAYFIFSTPTTFLEFGPPFPLRLLIYQSMRFGVRLVWVWFQLYYFLFSW